MSIKYNFKERTDWIESIQPNFNKQSWLNEKVYHPTDLNYKVFFEHHRTYEQEINPKDIIGIEYGFGYNCPMFGKVDIDWNYMLRNLKRLDRVIDSFKVKERLIEHIHRDRDPKSVIKYGSHFFTTSGQHRLFLAKSLQIEKVKVSVREYKLNKSTFVNENHIEKNRQKLIDFGFVRDNFVSDIKQKYILLLIGKEHFHVNKKFIRDIIERYETLKNDPIEYNYVRIKSILNFKEQEIYIKTFSDLKHLDSELVNHIKKQKVAKVSLH